MEGWTIYIDANGNGQWDGPETENIFDVTGADGSYTLGPLATGTYTVGEVAQPAWLTTYPALEPGDIQRVSVASDGSQATVGSNYASISATDGLLPLNRRQPTSCRKLAVATERSLSTTGRRARPNG